MQELDGVVSKYYRDILTSFLEFSRHRIELQAKEVDAEIQRTTSSRYVKKEFF